MADCVVGQHGQELTANNTHRPFNANYQMPAWWRSYLTHTFSSNHASKKALITKTNTRMEMVNYQQYHTQCIFRAKMLYFSQGCHTFVYTIYFNVLHPFTKSFARARRATRYWQRCVLCFLFYFSFWTTKTGLKTWQQIPNMCEHKLIRSSLISISLAHAQKQWLFGNTFYEDHIYSVSWGHSEL